METFDVCTIAPIRCSWCCATRTSIQEVAGLIAAAFAYGRAEIIVANLGAVLAKMTPSLSVP